MAKESATWQLMRTLGRDIVAGVYPANAPFPIEQTICETHNLSRSVVREAIKVLAGKGLVISRPKVGIRIRPREDWNLLDPDVLEWTATLALDQRLLLELLQMRRAVEPEAAWLAASLANSDRIAAIEAAYAGMCDAEHGNADPLESDVAFHCALLSASENRLFEQLGSLVRSALRAGIQYTNRASGEAGGNLDAHHAILIAIQEGDARRARNASLALIENAVSLVAPKSTMPVAIELVGGDTNEPGPKPS